MQTITSEAQNTPELVPLNPIRVETALSRYPVHRLAKQGTVSIEIREKGFDGDVLVQWQVSHNSRYGQSGPLAYKIDTLIVNRRIEEATRPIPRLLRLGSIHDICRELGIRGGKTREQVKKALYQNASAFITAKLDYVGAGGKRRELEAGFSRYSVVFTGEELPDGRRADGVYIVLNEVFMQVINGAQVRPLDYDYLKALSPASQRLYELLSFQMYATLKYGRKEARLSYTKFCTYAPLTRFYKWDQVRPQLARLHRPHLKAGYIESVDFEQAVDGDGKPDWVMVYVPGTKARAEYRAFTKRGSLRVLEIEVDEESPESPAPPASKPSPLEQELVSRGVTRTTASDLVSGYPEERIRRQLEYFEWRLKHQPKKISDSPGGYLAQAIRGDYAPPPKFETKAEQERKILAKRETERQEAEAKKLARDKAEREKEAHNRILAYWNALSIEQQQELDAKAETSVDSSVLAIYRDLVGQQNPMRDMYFKSNVRWPHIRELLGLPKADG